jgi:Domain of unknown function (DUF1990)
MQRRQSFSKRWSTAIRWPLGIALTSWRYMWRTTAVHRWEMTGSMLTDVAPELPEGVARHDIQTLEDGEGPFVCRLYRTRIVGSSLTPEELMAQITEDLDRVAPSEFATFQKIHGDGRLAVGDEYLVRMPGPWDGPVRVVAATPTSFRLATLAGHLEAGQIEFRAGSDHRSLGFEIESWARSGDRFADALYSHLRLAKEIQLHMWTSVLERVVCLTGGRREGGVAITTRRIDVERLACTPPEPPDAGPPRKLTALAQRAVNFDTSKVGEYTPSNGWHRDDMVETLPHEGSGPPAAGGCWHIARRLMVDYQLADPRSVRAVYRQDAPLAGRDILLKIRFAGVRFNVGGTRRRGLRRNAPARRPPRAGFRLVLPNPGRPFRGRANALRAVEVARHRRCRVSPPRLLPRCPDWSVCAADGVPPLRQDPPAALLPADMQAR